METLLPGIKTLPRLPPRTESERSVENSSDDGAHSITHYFISFIMEKDINWYTLRFCFHVVNSITQTLITSLSFGVLAGR